MNIETLTNVGLTIPQAKAYITLIREGSLTPPELAAKISESRTNAYKILDRLVDMGVARKATKNKRVAYHPENPISLESAAKHARDKALQHEKQVKDAMPLLLNYFYTYAEQPGVRFFQGKDGVREVFNDTLRTGKTIYLIRSPGDVPFYDEDFFATYRAKRAKLGIKTHALTVDIPSAVHDPKLDEHNKFIRTWLSPESYTAPVEYDIYGDKVAIISYGQEAMGIIIDSPQIAESFRQLFGLMRAGAVKPASS
jgi:sugar-specific transcriptional regulator TrmB